MSQIGFLKNFHRIYAHDWSINYHLNRYYLLNNYTADQFVYEEIQAYSKFMQDMYINRHIYTMPNTPQIILSTNKNIGKIQMLVQTAPFSLNKLINKNICQNTIKQILKNVLKTIQILVKKYGFFIITKKMVRVTSSSNLLIWINEDFQHIYRQFPLNNGPYENCKLMVFNILSIFQDVIQIKNFQSLRKRTQSQKSLTFQKFRIIFETNLKFCAVQKIKKRRRVSEIIPDFERRKTFNIITSNSQNERCSRQKALAKNVNIISQQPFPLHYNSQRCLNKVKVQFQRRNLLRSVVQQNQDKKQNKKLPNLQQQHLKSLQTTSYLSCSSENLKQKISTQIKKQQQNNTQLNVLQRKFTYDNLSPSIIEDTNEQILSAYGQDKFFVDLEQQFKQIFQQKNNKNVQQSSIFYQLKNQLESILNQCI